MPHCARSTLRLFATFTLCATFVLPNTAPAQDTAPASAPPLGFHLAHLQTVEPLIEQAIAERKMPGCVLVIGRRGGIGWYKAYGHRSVEPERIAMTTDTVFDLASLTKPIATAMSVMLLVQREQLRLDTPVAQLIPDFAAQGKQAITIQHLLTHTSGLIADNALSDYEHGRDEALRRIYTLRPVEPEVGKRFIYSDVNFILLGELIHQTTRQNLHQFTQKELFQPLGMHDTGFLPRAELRPRTAPTQQRAGQWLQGEVHDPRADKLGGIAGHAGLFATAADLARFAQHLLADGTTAAPRILSSDTLTLMTRSYDVPRGIRGLGWDKKSPYSSNRAMGMSDAAYGHGGFTGTVLWIDPQLDLFYIFLSNRVHPDGKGNVNALAGQIGTIAVQALAPPR